MCLALYRHGSVIGWLTGRYYRVQVVGGVEPDVGGSRAFPNLQNLDQATIRLWLEVPYTGLPSELGALAHWGSYFS